MMSKNNSEETIKMESHTGPVNMNFIFLSTKNKVHKTLQSALKKLFEQVWEVAPFQWRCEFKNKEYCFHLKKLDNKNNTFVLTVMNGTIHADFPKLSQKLFEETSLLLNKE